jgi:hypothetical protein
MNHFVDFGKRSIELPTGCKDLIDVLQQGKRPAVPSTATRVGQSLGELSKHLVNLLVSSTRPKNLVIAWGSLSYIHLRNNEQVLTAIVVVHGGLLREQSVRAVFGVADLAPVSDETAADGSIRVLRYSLPATASIIGRLIPNLLLKGFGLALKQVKYELGNWEEKDS